MMKFRAVIRDIRYSLPALVVCTIWFVGPRDYLKFTILGNNSLTGTDEETDELKFRIWSKMHILHKGDWSRTFC